MALDPIMITPPVLWNTVVSKWECSPEMSSWLSQQRTTIIGELISHGNWFSRPPRREMIEAMFSPWCASDAIQFVCPTPILPEDSNGCVSAKWSLDGVIMSANSFSPVWSIHEIQGQPDTITLLDDAERDVENDGDSREIQFHEIETDKQTAPTKLKSREWEARKFLGKERVREARLKAQIAKRIAKKEESRYYEQFGVPDDNESRISDFDLTDSDSDSDSDSELDSKAGSEK
jgi:hypothetical protein